DKTLKKIRIDEEFDSSLLDQDSRMEQRLQIKEQLRKEFLAKQGKTNFNDRNKSTITKSINSDMGTKMKSTLMGQLSIEEQSQKNAEYYQRILDNARRREEEDLQKLQQQGQQEQQQQQNSQDSLKSPATITGDDNRLE